MGVREYDRGGKVQEGEKKMAGYICKIVIEDTHPPVWRRVLLPEGITFETLHKIIQVVFGWEDEHLHVFETPDRVQIVSDDEDGDGILESETQIDLFFQNHKWIRYIYDFGDEWRHKINIEKLDEEYQGQTAVLLKVKGDNFMEDSGGVWNRNEDNRVPFDEKAVTEKLEQMNLAKATAGAADDLEDRGDWEEVLYAVLRYKGGLSENRAQILVEKCVTMIQNGCTLNHIIETMDAEERKIRPVETAVEIWESVTGLMLELELPFLNGQSRIQYGREQKCSAWTLGMIEESVGEPKTWKRMHQFPAKVQEWMYDAYEYGVDSSFQKLWNYKEENQIVSEEYLYLMAYAYLAFDEQEYADKAIQELSGISKTGKQAAEFLNDRVKKMYGTELDEEEADDMEEWEDIDWLDLMSMNAQTPKTYVRMEPKIGRNDPCPCGSGKKYKKCCGK